MIGTSTCVRDRRMERKAVASNSPTVRERPNHPKIKRKNRPEAIRKRTKIRPKNTRKTRKFD